MSGLTIGVLFIPASLFYGVYFDRSWMYLVHAFAAVILFSVCWFLIALAADKFGTPIRNGEGWMVMMAPVTFFPAIFAFAVVSKLIFDFIRSLL